MGVVFEEELGLLSCRRLFPPAGEEKRTAATADCPGAHSLRNDATSTHG